jgi:hypothetical protein
VVQATHCLYRLLSVLSLRHSRKTRLKLMYMAIHISLSHSTVNCISAHVPFYPDYLLGIPHVLSFTGTVRSINIDHPSPTMIFPDTGVINTVDFDSPPTDDSFDGVAATTSQANSRSIRLWCKHEHYESSVDIVEHTQTRCSSHHG